MTIGKTNASFSLISGVIALFLFNFCTGQDKKFTYSEVYGRGQSQLMGKVPAIVGWLDDQSYLLWKPDEKQRKEILQKIDAESGETTLFVDFSEINDRFQKGRFLAPWETHTSDYKKYIIRYLNDLYYFSTNTNLVKKLTDSESIEMNPTFSPDGRYIAFTREHDLYAIEIESGTEHCLTKDGSDLVYNGYASWVYYEEILGRKSRYKAFWWSPDSKMIAFLRFDDSPVPEFPIYHHDGIRGHVELQRYPKAGDPNPLVKLGVVHLKDRSIKWLETNEDDDDYLAWPFWTMDSRRVLYQSVNRDQDTIQIYKSDPLSASKELIYEESQSSWINFFDDLYVLRDGSGYMLRSDKSGWRHLYLYDLDGKLVQQLTEGDWNVDKICQVDEKKQEVFFLGFIDNSVETHLFAVNFDGSGLRRITTAEGTHSLKVSPSGTYFIDSYSNIDHPQKVVLLDREGETIRLLGDKNSPVLESYDLCNTEIFTIQTDDGIKLPALWILPSDFDHSKKYPVILQVYGGPGRANVRNQFRSLSNRYLVQNGMIIFTVDHRGSYHFGKNGQSLMHRHLGKWEMNDYIQAVKWLRKFEFVDREQIGIVGGSYGGYVVSMALTYGSDYFTHGVAQYSVTDWHLYDSFYTERFMDRPEENPEGYTFGSALTHAKNYKGKMLLIHGSLDDNVHLQNTTQLIEMLQKLDMNFELMIYPNQRHGARGAWGKHSRRETVNFWFRHFFGRELELNR
jgi:dipeptidyl-peptidase-4